MQKVAAKYEQQGYEVLCEPSLAETPERLRPYPPDLIATKGAERWIVMVGLLGQKHRLSDWGALAEKTSQAGWHFQIVVGGEPGDELRSYVMPEPAEVEAALPRPAKLAAEGEQAAALVLAWSLFEAAGRRRLLRDGQDPARASTPMDLATALVVFGCISNDELAKLRPIAELHNQIVHGLFKTQVPADAIDLLASLTRRLLIDDEQAA